MVDIVIDSCVLIEIVHFYMKNVQKPRNQRERLFFEVKNLIEDRKINPIVTPTIKKEIIGGSKYDNGLGQKFIARYCEVPEFDDYAEGKSLVIADSYGNFPIDDFPAIEHAQDYLTPNYNDARIVAETATLQKLRGKTIPLLTDNYAHVSDIARINKINIRHNVPEIHIHSLRTLKDAVKIAKAADENHSEK